MVHSHIERTLFLRGENFQKIQFLFFFLESCSDRKRPKTEEFSCFSRVITLRTRGERGERRCHTGIYHLIIMLYLPYINLIMVFY